MRPVEVELENIFHSKLQISLLSPTSLCRSILGVFILMASICIMFSRCRAVFLFVADPVKGIGGLDVLVATSSISAAVRSCDIDMRCQRYCRFEISYLNALLQIMPELYFSF